MHVLIDANVPLDMWLEPVMSRHSVDSSTLVFDAVAKGRITAYITPTIFSNVFFFLRKHLGQAKAIPLAMDLLLHTKMLGQDPAVFRNALESGWSDTEDAAQYFAAKQQSRITHICTSNTKHFKAAKGIKVVSPAALLKSL
ncbi:MAG: PIN domain-containing protein [Flavobacteriales bacterium]